MWNTFYLTLLMKLIRIILDFLYYNNVMILEYYVSYEEIDL